MIMLDFSQAQLRLKNEDGKTLVYDDIRKKWIVLTPEEHVRQSFLSYITSEKIYPQALIAVEKRIQTGERFKRFDVVVYDRNHHPWMLVECKEPSVSLTQHTLFQLLNYQRVVQSRYWVVTNGHQTFCADAKDANAIRWLNELPIY